MNEYKLSGKALVMISGSSKGTQPKYYDNGYWYKLNQTGYEATAECLASLVLKNSNVDNYVTYERCLINGKNGCRSESFLSEGETFLSFERLYNMTTGGNLSDKIMSIGSIKDRIDFVLDFVHDTTGLDCHDYLAYTLSLDALLLNNDRHFNNLGIIADSDGIFSYAPIFDNGCALLSNFSKFPPYETIEDNIEKVVGRPFSANLYAQAEALGFPLQIDYSALYNDLASEPGSRGLDVLYSQLEKYRDIIPDMNEG
ncbi:MAG: hypothetical protein LUF92_08820 [Clostridiales bacterium]|nr:hypothetical protein [Clostridiales bacterium]